MQVSFVVGSLFPSPLSALALKPHSHSLTHSLTQILLILCSQELSSMSFLSKFLGGLVLALVAALCLLVLQSDQPFLAPDSLPHSLTLGEGGYNTRELTAPVATGPLLEAIAYALTATRAGPLLRRSLLAANGFEAMRTLAEQVSAPPLYFPMRRLSRSEEEKASEAVGESVSLLETPLQELEQGVKVDVGFRTVTDYAKQYSLGLQVRHTHTHTHTLTHSYIIV
jgi:hypothetical protein